MPSRNEHNAIIFAGTMGLIRRSVLEEIGGWDEWCITEDAEASLRILKRGYQSLYIKKSYGRGLMPFNFEGLKKQRFRWCFGGIQILKKHWEALMPWARWVDSNNYLTLAQRYYYLVGGLQWFTDLFNLLFSFFLVLGAIFSLVPTPLQIRPITSAIVIMPALFLVLNLWRFVWVLRNKLDLSIGEALKTMFNFFSLGWAVTLASIQGIIQKKGVFLRTPKSQSGSRAWQAIHVTQWETIIGLICIGSGFFAFIVHPGIRTIFLGGLLIWQSSLYLSAPVYSLLSARSDLAPTRPIDRGQPVLEHWAARWALGLAALALVAVGVYQLLPGPSKTPSYTRLQAADVPPAQLFGLLPTATPTPTPTKTPKPTKTPRPTQTPGGSPGFFTSPTPTMTIQVISTQVTATATATVTATPTSAPEAVPTLNPESTPMADPTLNPESTPLTTPTATPQPSLTPPASGTPSPTTTP